MPLFARLALHSVRTNASLLDATECLAPQLRAKDTGGFFGSIMNHWNHIMFADLIFMKRLIANGVGPSRTDDLAAFPVAKSPTDLYFAELDVYRTARLALDRLVLRYVAGLTVKDIGRHISYTTTEGEWIEIMVQSLILHLFLHQTHHRGQISCMLSQFGIDYGSVDMPVRVPEPDAELHRLVADALLAAPAP